jgi:hypothetical protein
MGHPPDSYDEANEYRYDPTAEVREFPFTLGRVKGGWQVYDVERREHIGRVWSRQAYAEQALDTLRDKRPPIVRFVLAGSIRADA